MILNNRNDELIDSNGSFGFLERESNEEERSKNRKQSSTREDKAETINFSEIAGMGVTERSARKLRSGYRFRKGRLDKLKALSNRQRSSGIGDDRSGKQR